MRYINRERLLSMLPEDWATTAQRALAEVRDAYSRDGQTPAERNKAKSTAIEANSTVWCAVKPALKKLSHGKCWYCETSLERAMGDVEHFRPKKHVTQCLDHDGYWWLSFELSNLRLSCDKCNKRTTDATGTVGGKGNHFPLIDEKTRVFAEGDVSGERPQLIDPEIPFEPGWLYFNQRGLPEPKPNLADEAQDRVKKSIELFHLDEPELNSARETKYFTLREIATAAETLYEPVQQGDKSAIAGYKFACQQLHRMLTANAEYSAANRCMLMGLRGSNKPWIDDILQSN